MSNRRNWFIEATEKGYYFLTFESCVAMGDKEGFFTSEEMAKIETEMDMVYNPDVPRSHVEAITLKTQILTKCLTPDRLEEYKEAGNVFI